MLAFIHVREENVSFPLVLPLIMWLYTQASSAFFFPQAKRSEGAYHDEQCDGVKVSPESPAWVISGAVVHVGGQCHATQVDLPNLFPVRRLTRKHIVRDLMH